jgi:dTDP-4-dehydrorhamnose reductase
MRIVITGSAGMLGQDVISAARDASHDVIPLSRSQLDVTDRAAVTAALGTARAEVVVNCAAWTDVDGAEQASDAAHAVNGPGAGNVAQVAAQTGAWTIHVSSDYVFDGHKRQPYVESDPVGPRSVYGSSKLEGERAVARAAPERHTIVRSSWLFGAGGPCFPATILRLAAEREELTVVEDQIGCPTFTGHLAQALIELAGGSDPPPIGVVHMAGAGQCSWYEFAREIVTRSGEECEVKPGRTADLARPAPRPAFSVLGTERGAELPGLPDWNEGLADFLATRVGTA